MSFIWPVMLVCLVLVPLSVVWYLRMQQRRRQLTARYGGTWLMPQSAGRSIGLRRHVPPAIFAIGMTILLIALARPQAVLSLPRVEGTVILAFDVSGSMAADDLKPSRMEAAKTAAREFVQRQPPTVQVGVVAFSDSGFAAQAPTNDRSAIFAAIDRLAPQRGTSLAHGIEAALNTIVIGTTGQGPRLYSNLAPTPTPTPTPVPKGTYSSAVVVLLSDGENNESPDPLAAAQTAADRGVRIYTVGIGSPAGTNLHINGFTVHTQLDAQTLQQISEITSGTYYNADNEQDLRGIYENINPQLIVKSQMTEITFVFAGLSTLILLVGGTLSLLWFNRLP